MWTVAIAFDIGNLNCDIVSKNIHVLLSKIENNN